MRIAVITETWRPSVNGVVTRLMATFDEFRRRGHELLVVAPAGCDEPIPGATIVGAPSFRVPFIYGGHPLGIPLPLPGRWRAIEAFGPDVIHAVNPVMLGWAGIDFARRRAIPLVCSYHTHVLQYARYYHLAVLERPGRRILHRAHAMADLNLVTSPASAAYLRGWGLDEVRLWRGAVDLDRFHPDRSTDEMRSRLTDGHPERRLIIHVGRLAKEKGIHQLGPLASGERHLALVGAGPAAERLKVQLAGHQVTFAGPMYGRQLASAYASSDLFAFPSVTDTLGLAVLEAMASGLPVLAARSDASASVLAEASAARLVDLADPVALVAAAEDLLGAGFDPHAIATEARQHTATWAEATDDLLGAYREAIALSGARLSGGRGLRAAVKEEGAPDPESRERSA
ncbi:MAG TPA: glycosyltransferase family 1 protein [Candidatus Dormibacteraeota bacterium]|jgi:glycosyltransferase involved in cell wall biosynthesis|nr:glycosyltransferase family 1 protein [Candidatus Dormibacteraeota bacterium]